MHNVWLFNDNLPLVRQFQIDSEGGTRNKNGFSLKAINVSNIKSYWNKSQQYRSGRAHIDGPLSRTRISGPVVVVLKNLEVSGFTPGRR